jgi:sarcosine oxidase delta subunit
MKRYSRAIHSEATITYRKAASGELRGEGTPVSTRTTAYSRRGYTGETVTFHYPCSAYEERWNHHHGTRGFVVMVKAAVGRIATIFLQC